MFAFKRLICLICLLYYTTLNGQPIRARHHRSYTPVLVAPMLAGPKVELFNATRYDGATEEAVALCSVKTEHISANANATVVKRLHGVVTSKEFSESLHRLEVIIFGQMQQIMDGLDDLKLQYKKTAPKRSYQGKFKF